MNTFNGVYILDVTDPAAPMRLAHVSVVSSAVDIQNYPGRASIFPYDQEERRQCPIAGIACDEGVLYMASPMTYTYIYDGVELQPWLHTVSEKVLNTPIEKDNGTFYDLNIETLGVSGLKHYKSTGQCYAVVAYNGLYYAACGAEGVVVLDQSLNKLSTIAIEGVAQDVQIYEGTLYCAEKMGGLGCYELSADGLSATEQWHYTTKRGVVRQVRLSPKGRWAILMVGPVYGEIISTETASYVLHCTASSQMYHHTLLNTLAGGRYTGIWAEGGKAFWYDFGADDEYNKPVLLDEWSGNVAAINNGSMTGGVPESDKFVLATRDIANGAGGGYAIYDITTGNAPPLVVKDANMPFSGKPLIFGNTLITGERINGRICFVDISMLSSPKVKSTVSVNGNPDIPIVDGNAVLVPLGYQGLIKFDLPK